MGGFRAKNYGFTALLCLVLLLCLVPGSAESQEQAPLDFWEPSDTTRWLQADSLRHVAQKYNLRRDSMISIHWELSAGQTLPGKKDTLKHIIHQAFDYHLKALEKHRQSNALLRRIYGKHLSRLDATTKGSTRDTLIKEALSLRRQADRLLSRADSVRNQFVEYGRDSLEEVEKLNMALAMEERGLDRMSSALELLQDFLGSIQTGGKVIPSPEGQGKTVREETSPGKQPVVTNPSDTADDEAGKVHKGVIRHARGDPPPVEATGQEMNTPVARKGLVFRVQIAASQKPISPGELNNIYSGPEDIVLHHEAGWYRYTIGRYPTYYQADSLRQAIQPQEAFVVAYRYGERISIEKAMGLTGNH
jgi:hypothetical protein